jgi:hypothetical protein
MFIIVDFPEPETPMTAMNSPCSIVNEMPQRMHFDVAHLVYFVNVIEIDDRLAQGARAPSPRIHPGG